MPLILSRAEILRVLDMAAVIAAVEQAHIDHACGRAVQPPRTAVAAPDSADALFSMPAIVPSMAAAGFKLFANTPSNRARGLPAQSSVIVLHDADTGRCRAVLDGGAITACRTAAASAVATRLLARPDSRVLGLVGAGNLARTHLEAMRLVLSLTRVLVYSRTRATAERFAADRAAPDLPIDVVDTPEEVVRGADVVCTQTPSPSPIVRGAWLGPGLHVNVVGSPPVLDHREVDTDAVVRSRVIVDDRDAVAIESGDLMIPCGEGAITPAHFADEIGVVAAGLKPGREDESQITMFKSVGVAIQDIATAALVLERAEAAALGVAVAF